MGGENYPGPQPQEASGRKSEELSGEDGHDLAYPQGHEVTPSPDSESGAQLLEPFYDVPTPTPFESILVDVGSAHLPRRPAFLVREGANTSPAPSTSRKRKD